MTVPIDGGRVSSGTLTRLEAALSFLGLGVQAPQPSLGNEAKSPAILHDAIWLRLSRGLLIALLVLGVSFAGDGLRDALDPRSRRRA